MVKSRAWQVSLAGCLLCCGLNSASAAPPSVAQMLQFQPRQQGVNCSTPTPEEQRSCKVKLAPGKRTGSSAWVLEDGRGLPLRRFFDSNGDKKIDIWSYYKDGIEVYREIDTNANDRADQYRWLNTGGMKWGVDSNEDGKIDGWKMISAEEVGHEVFDAAVQRDLHRLQALFVSEAELRALPLPAGRADQVRAAIRDAARRFQATLDKMPTLNSSAQFRQVEASVPHCASDGGEEDLIHYPSRAILFQSGDKHDWLHTGEIVKVGLAWRLLDIPSHQESHHPVAQPHPSQTPSDPEAEKLKDQIAEMDKHPPESPPQPQPHPATVRFNLERAQLVEKLVPRIPAGKDRENWIKQLFDNYSAAAQHSDAKDRRAYTRLKDLRDQAAKDPGAASMVSYADWRLLWAEYAPKMGEVETQKKWVDEMAKFVQAYPRAEDTPDALFHLGMTCEFAGREEEAKRYYHQLATNFPQHHLASKAAGAKRRLELVGNAIELHGPALDGSTYNIARHKGKVVVVYYWASFCTNCATDFGKLKQLHAANAAKGLELVFINLDDQKSICQQFLQSNPVPGTHLFESAADGGGLNSPYAIQYGIQGLPTLFLIGRDGKVINRTLQTVDLEEALKKAL